MDSLGSSGETAGSGIKINFKLAGKVKDLRTMTASEMAKFYPGQSGASLGEVAHHGNSEYGQYGIIDEEFLADLRTEPAKIDELVQDLGETREEVNIVARTSDGGFTRMLLKKNENGRYKEIKKGVNSDKKEKTHRQGNDLFIFEKGVKSAAA